jgi:hypothetical protein
MRKRRFLVMMLLTGLFSAFICEQVSNDYSASGRKKPVKVWIMGDSTVADYSLEPDYQAKRYPIMAKMCPAFMSSDSSPWWLSLKPTAL